MGAGADLSGSCGTSDPSEDVVYEFTAPATANYVFDTVGAGYDTVLYALDGCGGPEIACNDDIVSGNTDSQLVLPLSAGQTIIVVVDGYNGAAGGYNLHVAEVATNETDCADGIDNDLDTDCFDADCVSAPACIEVCDDGIDNDADGQPGCFDPDCGTDPVCAEGCTNGIDDNGNFAIDCADFSCSSDPACAPVCPHEVRSTVPDSIASTTLGLPDQSTGSCDTSSIYGPPPPASDATVEFTAPATSNYAFAIDGTTTGFDSILYVLDSCGGTELGCSDQWTPYSPNGGELVVVPMTAGQTVVAVVDGFGGQSGDFGLDIYAVDPSETSCADGIDNDADFAIDCADSDCDADPVCIETCDDGIDNDGDGLIECLDSDCDADPVCAPSCPDLTSSVVPDTVAGTTIGRPDSVTMSCHIAYGGSPDQTVEFTAPADGTFLFALDRKHTDFDTVMSFNGSCTGPELSCEDVFAPTLNGGETRAIPMLAGETLIVAIEGDQGATGDFELEIRELQANELDCADGIDDDADGPYDCFDPDCAADPACVTETACLDGADNDGDGAADCADADGSALPECQEICDDGIDNNGTLDLDCQDASCAGDPLCIPVCPNDVAPRGLPVLLTGSTTGAPDGNEPPCASLASGAGDVTYEFAAAYSATYTFDTIGSSYDTELYLLDGCGGPTLACNDDAGGGVLQSEVTAYLAAGQAVIIVVDGYGSSTGDYVLRVQ